MFCIQYLTLLWMVFFESVRAPTVQRRGKVGAKVVHRRCKAIWTHTMHMQSNVSLLVHLFCTSGADKAHASSLYLLCVLYIFDVQPTVHRRCKAGALCTHRASFLHLWCTQSKCTQKRRYTTYKTPFGLISFKVYALHMNKRASCFEGPYDPARLIYLRDEIYLSMGERRDLNPRIKESQSNALPLGHARQ